MKIIYYGLFLTPESESLLLQKESLLEKPVSDLHVTFSFKPSENLPDYIIGKTFPIRVIGSGRNENNHGFEVDIPSELDAYYTGAEKKHITVSLSEDGKPLDSKHLDFHPIEPFTVYGTMGYYISKKIVFENVQEQ